MKPLILSIPHSGTRAMMALVGCPHAHVYIREIPEWIGFTDEYLICPLRDPKAVWRSWVKRWNTGQGAVSLDLFQPQWEHLEALDKEYDIVYIPMMGDGEGHIDGPIETDHAEPDWDYIYSLPFVKRFFNEGSS